MFQSTPVISGGRNIILASYASQIAWFQSTPVISGGRNSTTPPGCSRATSFQSTPVISGGRNLGGWTLNAKDVVSIHARHFWRAKRSPMRDGWRRKSFQSTPVISGGRNNIKASVRAIPNGFNPRPSFLAGETVRTLHQAHAIKFQSTPVISGGRNAERWMRYAEPSSFNPRPSFLAGETSIVQAPQRG